ncbi:MAG: HNH endonuclease signature motif containing protein [Clostridia bacterium]
MPKKPLKPCAYPNCPKLVEGRYCAEHKKLIDKQYNTYERDKISQRFYQSEEWKLLRKRKLMTSPVCEECLRCGRITPAKICDHIKPISEGGNPLDINNLQSLCWSCHSRKSAKEGSRWGNRR